MKSEATQNIQETIALYGGSFDPVHTGHLKIARIALVELGLDKVVFIPAAASPLKRNAMQAGSEDRIEMLRLATEEEPAFVIDTREIERGGTSFTVDTVRSFRSDSKDAKLFWILGADQLELLPNWRSIEELVSMLTFIVFKRTGFSLEKPSVPGLQLVEIEAPLMEQSSSEIRQRIAKGAATGDWLPASVGAFISAHQLYTR